MLTVLFLYMNKGKVMEMKEHDQTQADAVKTTPRINFGGISARTGLRIRFHFST